MLANQNLAAANALTAIYTSPAGLTRTVFSVSACNRSGGTVAVSLFLVAAGTGPDASNAIEWSSSIPANTTLERSGLVLKSGQTLYASCSVANAAAIVAYGIEE